MTNFGDQWSNNPYPVGSSQWQEYEKNLQGLRQFEAAKQAEISPPVQTSPPAQQVNPTVAGGPVLPAAMSINPGQFQSALLEIAAVYDQAQNAIAGQLQLAMTPADVARMQAQTAIKNQIKEKVAVPAVANQAAREQIEAQLAGQIAGIGEAVIPQKADDDTTKVRKWLVANAGLTQEQADKEIIAGDKTKLKQVDESLLNEKNYTVKDANGVEHPKYAPSRLLPVFMTDDQRFAQCTLPYHPVVGAKFGNVFCEYQPDNELPSKPVPQPEPEQKPDTPSLPSQSGDCIKVEICNWPQEKSQSPQEKKDDTACKKWKLYTTREGVCYVIPSDGKPRSSDDSLQTEGEFSPDWLDRIVSTCGKKDEKPTKQPSNQQLDLSSTSITSCTQDGLLLKLIQGSSVRGILKALGIDAESIKASAQMSVAEGLANPGKAVINAAVVQFAKAFEKIISPIDTLIETLSTCDAVSVNETVVLAVTELSKYISGSSLDPYTVPIKYDRDSRCPYLLPTASDALQAYLANQINLEQLNCLVRANGQKWEPFAPSIEANRAKHTSLDLASLLRRGVISEREYDTRIRELGYLHSSDASEVLKLTEQIPGPQDIIRLMVRDTANQEVVNKFNLDVGFEKNYNGQLKEWAKNQGVPDQVMQYLWRAHWDIPSPTQLYEMYRRLRHSDKYNANKDLDSDVRAALVQQDIAPYWIDRLLALSFNPLTRTDARRAYEIGSITKKELWNSFIDSGYSDENATRLTDFADKQLQLKYYRHPMVSRYAQGVATSQDLEEALSFEGAKPDQIDLAKARGKKLARMESRKACSKSVKRRYFIGDLDEFELVPKLTQLGIDDDMASILASGWICERAARGKTIPAMRLAKLFQAGVIDEAKYVKNLVGLGYTADSALDLLAEQRGIMDEAKRKKKEVEAKKAAIEAEKKKKKAAADAKEQQRQAKDQQSQEAKVVADAAKQAKAADAAANRLIAAQQKGLKTIQDRANKLRNIQLDIAVNISKKTGEYLGDILNKVEAYVRSRRTGGIDPMAFADCGLAASKTFTGSHAEDFFPRWESCWTSPTLVTTPIQV